jgi:hypothetical protein
MRGGVEKGGDGGPHSKRRVRSRTDLAASRDRGRVADHVRGQSLELHVVQEGEGALPTTTPSARRDGPVVADAIRRDAVSSHGVKEKQGLNRKKKYKQELNRMRMTGVK